MLRLPSFRYLQPKTLTDALRMKADAGPTGMFVAGGTDLYPNMKRRHQEPRTVISLMAIPELRSVDGWTVGTCVTLTELSGRPSFQHSAIATAARLVSTPLLRNMGTLGGNLCLDTRCNYYNQSYEWRKAIDFCLKVDGKTCWVATASKRCVAVSSTDTAPALIALNAKIKLVSAKGEREIPVEALYKNDGIEYLSRAPDEVLTEVRVPEGWRSAYWKLRRRGSFDFPILGVAAAVKLDGEVVREARIALGAVASRPFLVEKAGEFLRGRKLSDEAIAQAAELVANRAKPMDNTDMDLYWRKEVTAEFATYALRELRGDDVRAERLKIARLVV